MDWPVKRDYKRECKGQQRATLDSELFPVVNFIASDQALDPRYRDPPLAGDWKDHRDCHIKPDKSRTMAPYGLCGLGRIVSLGFEYNK